jgi:hypothetical protein
MGRKHIPNIISHDSFLIDSESRLDNIRRIKIPQISQHKDTIYESNEFSIHLQNKTVRHFLPLFANRFSLIEPGEKILRPIRPEQRKLK